MSAQQKKPVHCSD